MNFLFELPLKRNGYFVISSKSLTQIITHPSGWEEFKMMLERYNVKLKKIDQDLSIIK